MVVQFAIARIGSRGLREDARDEGGRLVGSARHIAAHADAYLAATQVGITLSCLGLGWLAAPATAAVIGSPLRDLGASEDVIAGLSVAGAFGAVVAVTVVAGRLAPRLLARRIPEPAAGPGRPSDLGQLKVRDLMVPRTRIDALPSNLSREEARDRMLELGRSRIPVYQDNLDQIVGMVEWAKLFGSEGPDWEAHVEPMLVVPESLDAAAALARMRERPVPEVLVVDEYGGTAGLLTLAAVVNQVAGRRAPVTLPASVPGEHPIHLLERDLLIQFPASEATTIAGFMAERLGHLPAAGDAVEVDGHHIVVAAVAGRRIRTIRVE